MLVLCIEIENQMQVDHKFKAAIYKFIPIKNR